MLCRKNSVGRKLQNLSEPLVPEVAVVSLLSPEVAVVLLLAPEDVTVSLLVPEVAVVSLLVPEQTREVRFRANI